MAERRKIVPWHWTVIAFDLEGTDLIRQGRIPHITQWSAYELITKTTFNCYVMPKIPIPPRVQKLTGISVKKNRSGSSQLIAGGEVKQALTIRQAIRNFLDWLDLHEFRNVILVAHGGEGYDFPVLVSALNNNDELQKFHDRISGFLDSLPLMRKKFPKQTSHKLVDLVKTILKDSYSAHQAEEDTIALAKLLIKSEINADEICDAKLTPMDVHISIKKRCFSAPASQVIKTPAQSLSIQYRTEAESPSASEAEIQDELLAVRDKMSPEESRKLFPWQPWTVIAFNLKVTDLGVQGQTPHINQWSAYELTTKATFNCYIIARGAQKMTGISLKQNRFRLSELMAGGEVQALSIRQAIRNFLDWLDLHEFQNVVLGAQGGYDFKVCVRALNNIDEFERFRNKISGFLESLPWMRKKFPEQRSYDLENLVKTILKDSYSTHKAVEETIAHAKLLIKSEINADYISDAMYTPLDVNISLQEVSSPAPTSQLYQTPAHTGQSPSFQDRSEADTPSASEAELSKTQHWLQYSRDELLAIRNKMSTMDIIHCLKSLIITRTKKGKIFQGLPWTVTAFNLLINE